MQNWYIYFSMLLPVIPVVAIEALRSTAGQVVAVRKPKAPQIVIDHTSTYYTNINYINSVYDRLLSIMKSDSENNIHMKRAISIVEDIKQFKNNTLDVFFDTLISMRKETLELNALFSRIIYKDSEVYTQEASLIYAWPIELYNNVRQEVINLSVSVMYMLLQKYLSTNYEKSIKDFIAYVDDNFVWNCVLSESVKGPNNHGLMFPKNILNLTGIIKSFYGKHTLRIVYDNQYALSRITSNLSLPNSYYDAEITIKNALSTIYGSPITNVDEVLYNIATKPEQARQAAFILNLAEIINDVYGNFHNVRNQPLPGNIPHNAYIEENIYEKELYLKSSILNNFWQLKDLARFIKQDGEIQSTQEDDAIISSFKYVHKNKEYTGTITITPVRTGTIRTHSNTTYDKFATFKRILLSCIQDPLHRAEINSLLNLYA